MHLTLCPLLPTIGNMERTISNNQILALFLGLAVPLILGGCASVPETPTPPGTQTPPAANAEVPLMVTAAAPVTTVAPEETKADPVVIVPRTDNEVVVAEEPEVTEIELYTVEAFEEPFFMPDNSMWTRLRAGFRLPPVDSPLIERHERWFVENVEYREAMFERAKLYLYFIVEEVEKRGMPMEIALLPAIESAYKPYAYSRARASGLWQFIPSTGRLYGLKTNWWYDGRRDVVASTRAALDYLQKLVDDFDGDWQLALAAYNAGEGRVMRAVEWNRRRGLPTDYVHLRQLKLETKHYLPKLTAIVNIVSDPERFGIQLPEIPNAPYFAKVEVDSQVDLGVIARLTGIEVDHLHFINPGYRRWATGPNGPHHVLVPAEMKDAVLAGLSSLPEHERVQWLHHKVRRGETLSHIARRYKLSVPAIRSANNLRGDFLRIGQSLMLPISATARPPATAPGRSGQPVRAAAKTSRPLIHRVRRGETLTSIARRYNVLVRQIAEWNLMDPNDILRMGRRLKIWTNDGPQAYRQDPQATIYA